MRFNFVTTFILCFILAFPGLMALGPGDMAPPFANPDLDGRFHFSRNYLQQGWVLMDFFASWCDPCKEGLPAVIELNRRYAEYGLFTILFAIDNEGESVVAPFFAENPVDFPVLLDRYQVTMRDRYHETAVPVYFLIDPSGMIRYKGQNLQSINDILASEFGVEEDVEFNTLVGTGHEADS